MIQEAVNALLQVKGYQKIVENYAKEKYYQKFPNGLNYWEFIYYNKCEVLDNKTIKVYYKYGTGHHEYDSSFTIDITEEIRQEKLNKII
jgi:hypothetical protein